MDYLALTTYIMVICITPGPNNIMVTASGANFGYRATLPHLLGIVLGGAFQVAVCCLGLGAVFTAFPILHTALSWIGLAYMLYLAWKLLKSNVANNGATGKPLTFLQAALFQWVNPKGWIICVTLASVFLPKTGEVLTPTLIICVIDIVLCFFAVSFWTGFGSVMRKFLTTPRNQLIFNGVMAALLVYTAILIVL